MTSNKTSSLDYGIVQDDTTENDWQLMELDRKAQERWDQNEKAIEQRQRKEELSKDQDSIIKQYRASHFICGKVAIPLKFEAEIIKHKSQCPRCSSEIEDLRKAKEEWVAALAEMRGILSNIEESKETIETQKRKILRETKEKQQGWDTVVQIANSKIKESENIIQREQIHKHKMLNPDLNNLPATISEAVNDMYLQYEKLPSEKKKHFENYISYKNCIFLD